METLYLKKLHIKNIQYNFGIKKNNKHDLKILFYLNNNKLFYVVKLNNNKFYIKNNNIYFITKNRIQLLLLNFIKNIINHFRNFQFLQYNFFYKLNIIGLGYKNFVYKKKLYLLIGDSNYIIIALPQSLKVYCKKRQIYFLSKDKVLLFNLINKIKLLKKINYYKGKGIIEFNNFKFMKLKTGKKQRFM
jgi:ribosomal protein L6P/L9E